MTEGTAPGRERSVMTRPDGWCKAPVPDTQYICTLPVGHSGPHECVGPMAKAIGDAVAAVDRVQTPRFRVLSEMFGIEKAMNTMSAEYVLISFTVVPTLGAVGSTLTCIAVFEHASHITERTVRLSVASAVAALDARPV